MKVYLFSDYLKSIQGEPLSGDQSICDIDDVSEFPDGLISINNLTARVCSISSAGNFITIEFVGDILNDDEVNHSNEITCPHCGSEVSDSWECSDSDDNYSCDTCGSVFSYEREVEVTYNSTIVSRNASIQKLDREV